MCTNNYTQPGIIQVKLSNEQYSTTVDIQEQHQQRHRIWGMSDIIIILLYVLWWWWCDDVMMWWCDDAGKDYLFVGWLIKLMLTGLYQLSMYCTV